MVCTAVLHCAVLNGCPFFSASLGVGIGVGVGVGGGGGGGGVGVVVVEVVIAVHDDEPRLGIFDLEARPMPLFYLCRCHSLFFISW